MDRHNHYERAFDAFARSSGVLSLGVDEAQRCTLDDAPLKSPDFLLLGANDIRLAVDVKGRRYPSGPPGRRRHVWECWSTMADINGLARWAGLLGDDFVGLLVFVYHILPEVCLPEETPDLWHYQDRQYLFRAVAVEVYRERMRARSPKWGTVDLGRQDYARIVQPVSAFLGESDDVLANARERECWITP